MERLNFLFTKHRLNVLLSVGVCTCNDKFKMVFDVAGLYSPHKLCYRVTLYKPMGAILNLFKLNTRFISSWSCFEKNYTIRENTPNIFCNATTCGSKLHERMLELNAYSCKEDWGTTYDDMEFLYVRVGLFGVMVKVSSVARDINKPTCLFVTNTKLSLEPEDEIMYMLE